jgi:hypothetical protein
VYDPSRDTLPEEPATEETLANVIRVARERPLRSVFQPIVDLQSRRHMADDDRFALEQVEAQGAAASAPVGAGGAADRRAAVNR